MTLSNKNKSSIKPVGVKHIAFVLILFFSISSFSQNLPQIITDRKIASQNYLPDYSYAGYHFGEVRIPQKTEQVVNATDYGVIANDDLDDSKALLKAIKTASSLKGDVILQLPAGRLILSDVLYIERSNFVLRGSGSGENGTEIFCPRPMMYLKNPESLTELREYLTTFDNMMNLELLFEASKLTGDDDYKQIAIKHANTTLKNHFRKDNSCFHVIGYDTLSGKVKSKNTHQGYSDSSSWARGQSWAVYGFTMAYRYTKDKAYLKQAEATAKFFINHKNMPDDGIPYWDFNAPNIPNAYRDASAAAIMGSALIELYSFTKNETYLNYSNKVINSLSSKKYLLNESVNGSFILDHSTGDWSKKAELDEPIVYADFYYLEAIIRQKAL